MTDLSAVPALAIDLDHWLRLWARWMKQHSMPLGYPTHAPLAVSGCQDFEDLCDASDLRIVLAVNAAIKGLPWSEQAAVNHRWLTAVYRLREPIDAVYERALERIAAELRRRAVL